MPYKMGPHSDSTCMTETCPQQHGTQGVIAIGFSALSQLLCHVQYSDITARTQALERHISHRASRSLQWHHSITLQDLLPCKNGCWTRPSPALASRSCYSPGQGSGGVHQQVHADVEHHSPDQAVWAAVGQAMDATGLVTWWASSKVASHKEWAHRDTHGQTTILSSMCRCTVGDRWLPFRQVWIVWLH